jgi:hypothetical protein
MGQGHGDMGDDSIPWLMIYSFILGVLNGKFKAAKCCHLLPRKYSRASGLMGKAFQIRSWF